MNTNQLIKGTTVLIGGKAYRILNYEPFASKVYKKPHYRCRLKGRGCVDIYAEDIMTKI